MVVVVVVVVVVGSCCCCCSTVSETHVEPHKFDFVHGRYLFMNCMYLLQEIFVSV